MRTTVRGGGSMTSQKPKEEKKEVRLQENSCLFRKSTNFSHSPAILCFTSAEKALEKKFGLKSNFPWCNALFFYRYPFPSSCLSFNESFTILDMRYTKSTHAPPSKFLCRATECASATSKSFALFAKSSSSQPLNQTIKKTKTLWSLKLMWKCSGTATISPNNRQCSCINTYKDGRVRKREWKYDYLLIRCVPFIARAFKSPLLLSRSYSTYLVLDDRAAMNVTCTRKQTKKERQTFTL